MVPQGSVLGPLFFLIYINDLCKCVNHFADDTNMLLSHSSLETLAKQMNSDLKNLSQWLKANKLSLHVMKTELIIFHSSSKKTDPSLKIILDGKRLIQPDTVKYIGGCPLRSGFQMAIRFAFRDSFSSFHELLFSKN